MWSRLKLSKLPAYLINAVGLCYRSDLVDAHQDGYAEGWREGYFAAKQGVFYKEWARENTDDRCLLSPPTP